MHFYDIKKKLENEKKSLNNKISELKKQKRDLTADKDKIITDTQTALDILHKKYTELTREIEQLKTENKCDGNQCEKSDELRSENSQLGETINTLEQ